jgi:hypothetical protein
LTCLNTLYIKKVICLYYCKMLILACEVPLNQKLLLVDFENVQPINISHVGDRTNVIIFVGTSQKSIPVELVVSTQRLGERIKWQKVEGNGANAFDFHIACHFGRMLKKSPPYPFL